MFININVSIQNHQNNMKIPKSTVALFLQVFVVDLRKMEFSSGRCKAMWKDLASYTSQLPS